MSKIFNSLKDLDAKAKLTAAVNKNAESVASNGQPAPQSPSSPSAVKTVTLAQNTFVPMMIAFGLTGIFSLLLSFKTVIQMKDNEASLRNLTSIASEQNKKVKGVESSLGDFLSKQEQKVVRLEEEMQEVDKKLGRSEERLSRLSADTLTMRVNIDDLKTSHRDLRNRYTNLSDDVSTLKQVSMNTTSQVSP